MVFAVGKLFARLPSKTFFADFLYAFYTLWNEQTIGIIGKKKALVCTRKSTFPEKACCQVKSWQIYKNPREIFGNLQTNLAATILRSLFLHSPK